MSRSPENTGRKQTGRWNPGQSGNPLGKPRGARHAALAALDAIGADGATDVLRAVVSAAIAGDMRAAEILLRRLWPERKGRPVRLALPEIHSSADVIEALGVVAGALGTSELSPEEAQSVAALLEAHRKAIETADLEQRIARLETRTGEGRG